MGLWTLMWYVFLLHTAWILFFILNGTDQIGSWTTQWGKLNCTEPGEGLYRSVKGLQVLSSIGEWILDLDKSLPSHFAGDWKRAGSLPSPCKDFWNGSQKALPEGRRREFQHFFHQANLMKDVWHLFIWSFEKQWEDISFPCIYTGNLQKVARARSMFTWESFRKQTGIFLKNYDQQGCRMRFEQGYPKIWA